MIARSFEGKRPVAPPHGQSQNVRDGGYYHPGLTEIIHYRQPMRSAARSAHVSHSQLATNARTPPDVLHSQIQRIQRSPLPGSSSTRRILATRMHGRRCSVVRNIAIGCAPNCIGDFLLPSEVGEMHSISTVVQHSCLSLGAWEMGPPIRFRRRHGRQRAPAD